MSETDIGAGALEPSLPATTGDGAARARALTEARNTAVAPTGLVSYVSSGRLALVGSVAESSSAAERIEGTLEAVIVAPPGDAASGPGAARILHAAITAVEGHLGAFTLHAESDGSPIVVAPSRSPGTSRSTLSSICDPSLPLRTRFFHRATLRRAATRRRWRRRSSRRRTSSASSRSPATSATTRTSARTARPASAGAPAVSMPARPGPSARSESAWR